MKHLIKSVPASIVGFAVLIVLLSAGAAQSLAGTNTVTSDDIVDGTIVAADIKTAAIGGRPIVDSSILKADIGANGVGASELDTVGLHYRTIGVTVTAAGGGSSVTSEAE